MVDTESAVNVIGALPVISSNSTDESLSLGWLFAVDVP